MEDRRILAQSIASEMRRAILTKEYPPGSELRQERLAEHFHVSRMPIRQAIQLLADEDLVTPRKNRSALVNEQTDQDIQDHFVIRGLLEAQAASFAAQRGKDFSRLGELLKKCEDIIQTEDRELWEQYNYQFHEEIWNLANCRKLSFMIKQTWNAVSYVKSESPKKRMNTSNIEHARIYEAIISGDAELARIMTQRHVVQHNLKNFEIHVE